MKDKTKLLKAIQHLNVTKNTCWTMGYEKEHSDLVKIQNKLIKKMEALG